MIDTSSVRNLLGGLFQEAEARGELLDSLRFHGVYTGNFVDPFANWGGWGMVPLSGFSNGDIAALRPLFGRPIASWPVMQVSHVGDPGVTFASSLSTWIAAHLAAFEDADNAELTENRDDILALAAFLGDSSGRAQAVLDAILAEELPDEDADRYALIEGEGGMLARFHALAESDESAVAWRAFVAEFPDFPPAWYRLLSVLREAEEQPEDLLAIAWKVVNFDMQCDGSYKQADAAAWLLVEGGGERAYGSTLQWPAVVAMARDELCGWKWLEAARALEAGDPGAAYVAYKNAAYWIGSETEDTPSVTWQGGKRCAESLKEKITIELFDELEIPEKEDIAGLQRKYEEIEAARAAKAAAQAGARPLFEAARTGNLEALRAALQADVAVNALEDSSGHSALHLAAGEGHVPAVRLLLEHGADPSLKASRGQLTPLHVAVDAGHAEVAAVLIAAGAKPEQTSGGQQTALFRAADRGHIECVRVLLKQKAKVDAADWSEQTPLFRSVFEEHPEVAALLLEAGAKANAKDNEGSTPLHWAAHHGMTTTVQALLAHGAKPKAKDDNDRTPVDMATDEGHDEIVALLLGKPYVKPPDDPPDVAAGLKVLSARWELSVPKLKQLDELNFAYEGRTDEDLQLLFCLPKLRSIALNGCDGITDEGMKALARCPNLEELHLSGSAITNAGLDALAVLPNVKKLWLDDTAVDEAGLQALSRWTTLEWVRLNNLKFSDQALSALQNCRSLQKLELAGTSITDAACAAIGAHTRIDMLDLSDTTITDAGLASLKKLKILSNLNLARTNITDGCVALLAPLAKLGDLNLTGTKVTGAGFSRLKGLGKLLSLNLEGTKLSDAGVAELKPLKSLRVLDLTGTKITDAAVAHLKTMKHLNAVIVSKTKISKAGKAKLRGALASHVSLSWDE